MANKQISKLLPFTIVAISISSVSTYIEAQTNIPIANTTIWWSFHLLLLLILFFAGKYLIDKKEIQNFKFIKWYLIWNAICIVRGIFIVENYWDWKGLVSNSMVLLLPITAYAVSAPLFLQFILKYFLKYSLPLFLIIALMIPGRAYGFYLAPIGFLLLFLPVLSFRWKVVMLTFAIIVIFADFGARSNVIKFAVPILLLFLYYFKNIISIKIIEIFRKIIFITPIILFYLAVNGGFNVFKIDDYIHGDYEVKNTDSRGQKDIESLTSDTRTFLYMEVLQTAQKYNTFWFGRSPARGNETEWFYDLDISGRGERLSNEVAILNIFTWTGILGVILYFIVFYRASYLALKHSNNIFCKMLGIFIAFRWLYAWVEDINNFTLSYLFLWIMLGVCFSSSFRAMSNKEMKYWIRGIFKRRYRMQRFGKTAIEKRFGDNKFSGSFPQLS